MTLVVEAGTGSGISGEVAKVIAQGAQKVRRRCAEGAQKVRKIRVDVEHHAGVDKRKDRNMGRRRGLQQQQQRGGKRKVTVRDRRRGGRGGGGGGGGRYGGGYSDEGWGRVGIEVAAGLSSTLRVEVLQR